MANRYMEGSYVYGHKHDWQLHNSCNPGESAKNGAIPGSGCAQRILQDGWQMKY